MNRAAASCLAVALLGMAVFTAPSASADEAADFAHGIELCASIQRARSAGDILHPADVVNGQVSAATWTHSESRDGLPPYWQQSYLIARHPDAESVAIGVDVSPRGGCWVTANGRAADLTAVAGAIASRRDSWQSIPDSNADQFSFVSAADVTPGRRLLLMFGTGRGSLSGIVTFTRWPPP